MSKVDRVINKILEGADVRKTLCEGSDKSFPVKAFDDWWDDVKMDFMTGFTDSELEDADITWGVKLSDDGSVLLYGDINGTGLELNDFKDLLKDSGVSVGTDVNVKEDLLTGGFKVTFVKMTPDEFLEKVW